VHSASALAGAERIAQQSARLPPSAVVLGFVAMFVVMGSRASFAVTYPAMVTEMGWSVAELTSAFSAGLLFFGPLAVGVGYMTDRLGCRVTMLAGGVCLTVGMVLVAAATELWHLYVAFILANGLGSAAVGFVTVVKALSIRAPRRFAAAFGIASMGQGVGALILSPAIQGIIDAAGWRAGPITIAGIVAFGLLPLVLAFAPGREGSGRAHGARHDGDGARVLSLSFVVFFVANLCLGYQLLIPTHNVKHLQEAGFVPMTAALAAGAWGALTALGGAAGGIGLERWGQRTLLAAAVLLFGIGTGALMVSQPELTWLLLVFIVAGGFGRGILGTCIAASQTRAFAGPRLGRITGLLELAYGFGAFIGPWLTAVVHDQGAGFSPGFASSIVLTIIAAPLTLVGSALAHSPRRRTP
jgi:MFS family permease